MSAEQMDNRGAIWARVLEQTQIARDLGELHSIETEYRFLEDRGLHFLVRVVRQLKQKDSARATNDPYAIKSTKNPFLPYDKNMEVCQLSPTHVCLLNKYNVVSQHVLVLTKRFEDQLSSLTIEDFQATWMCLVDYPGLAFYNSGALAGASQRHKHLQVVPLPLASQGPPVPLAAAYQTACELGFSYRYADLDSIRQGQPAQIPTLLHQTYRELLRSLDLEQGVDQASQHSAYNLLLTRDWMLLVPRSCEHYRELSINALGFAGALLVRDHRELEILEQDGPLTALQHVSQV